MDERPPLLGQVGHLESHSASFYGAGTPGGAGRAKISPSGSSLPRVSELSDARISLMSYKESARSDKWEDDDDLRASASQRPSTVPEEEEEGEGGELVSSLNVSYESRLFPTALPRHI